MPTVAPPASEFETSAPGRSRGARRARKRADGEGTLYYDAKAKLWRGSLMIGMKTVQGKDGKPVQRPDRRKVSAKTQEACRARLDQLKAERTGGLLPGTSTQDTVSVFVDRWLAAKAGTVRERTHTRYGQLLRRHLLPALGKKRLGELKPDALQRLYAEKLGAGLAPRTVHHIHTVFHGTLEDAVRWGYVGRNVAERVEPPAVGTPELHWLTAEEVGRLLAASAAHGDRLEALWVVAAHTGMRLGELLGLTWDDVNLEAGALVIRRTLVKVVAQEPSWGEPKTKRSRRIVALSSGAVAALQAHYSRQQFEKARLGEDYGTYGLVFSTVMGTPISHHVALQYFRRALEWADLPAKVRIHDLRHAAASMMLGSGVDVPTVASVLGHARNSTTLDVYGHAVPKNVTGAMAALERAISGA